MSSLRINEPVVVFSGDTMEAELVRTLLNNAEIPAFLKDEAIGTLAPWLTTAGGAGAVKVIVRSEDLELANQVVAGYERNKG
jgi:hypothetical protein